MGGCARMRHLPPAWSDVIWFRGGNKCREEGAGMAMVRAMAVQDPSRNLTMNKLQLYEYILELTKYFHVCGYVCITLVQDLHNYFHYSQFLMYG